MNYNFQKKLLEIWEIAVELYRQGNRDSKCFPIENEIPFLESIGMNKMDIFDFAEDWVCEEEPDFSTFLLIHEQRRNYFIEVQKRIPSGKVLDPSLPAKTESIDGIVLASTDHPESTGKIARRITCKFYVLLRR